MSEDRRETRQERRERKLLSKRERIHKHGRSITRIYYQAVMKRLESKRKRAKKRAR